MNKDIERQLGWLSPAGDFIKCDWGVHEECAGEIIEANNWLDEYNEWNKDSDLCEYRDFLLYEKHYVLIDDPEACGDYLVSYGCRLTKHQKDYLYKILMDNYQYSLAKIIIGG